MRPALLSALFYFYSILTPKLAFTTRLCTGLSKAFILLTMLLPNNLRANEITPSGVNSVVNKFAQDLDLVRLELGEQKAGESPIYVTDAAPYEVFYQAMTLCKKANYIRFEWTRNVGQCPPHKLGQIKPSDVIKQVEAASVHINEVKKYFKITEKTFSSAMQAEHTPSNVFMSIMTENRQLNMLLKKRYAPDDVFREVTRGIYYSADLLANFPDIKQRIPTEPAFITQKTPADVYLRLIKAYSLIQLIHKSSRQFSGKPSIKSPLTITINQEAIAFSTPSDVYDIATLLVSELSQLQWYLKNQKKIQAYQPPPKIPSQVYQRSGILLQQLQLLLQKVKANPNWLDKGT